MKTTMLMLLSLIIAISLTENASSEIDCPTDYLEGDTVVVDTISCYKISIVYCYKIEEHSEDISLDLSKVIYEKIHEDCWSGTSFTTYLDDHYDELLEKHTKLILADMIEKQGLEIIFCEEGSKKILNVSTAACASTTLVKYYAPGPDGILYPYYARPKCAEESHCLSTYELCWYWSGVNAIAEMTLIRRIADIYETCPPSMLIDNPMMIEPVEVECRAICD